MTRRADAKGQDKVAALAPSLSSARSSPALPEHTELGRQVAPQLVACGINLLVIWLLNASLAPGINESHYLPKAKHAWDPTFAPGDLFLSSGNAHWLFAQIAGGLTTFLSLSAVAWVGRLLSWCLMAFAWQRFSSRMAWSSSLSAVVLAGWLTATRLGNWAGEWAVGGFEAKALAYPFVILALSHLIGGQWNRVWIFSGVAVAFHPLVGGWAGATFIGAWLCLGRRESLLRHQLLAGLAAAALSAIGIVPALMMLGGPTRSGDIVVAQIHAFYRLAHHQSPRLFSAAQHWSGAVTLLLLILATVLCVRFGRETRTNGNAQADNAFAQLGAIRRLLVVAWLGVAVSGCGVVIDFLGMTVRPDLAASLLRFYWFRWSDIVVPLAWVSALWSVAIQLHNPYATSWKEHHNPKFALKSVPAIVLALITLGCVSDQVIKSWRMEFAPADQTLLLSGNPQLASGPEVVARWQAVCAWAHEHTPGDALFLTPRAQQTFKWYAGRAEVVCYKDVPQDSRSLLEWYDRIGRCAPPRDANGQPVGWTTEQLNRLQTRYGFHYVIVDRRIQREPPLLELVYPLTISESATFAVFKMPPAPSR